MTEQQPTYEELAARVATLEQAQAAVAAVRRIIGGAPAERAGTIEGA